MINYELQIQVIDTCLYKGSRDNMSVIIIAFPSAPKVDPAAQKVEAELNASLEKRVTEIIASHDNEIELQMVHQRLVDEELVGLPPGGGLASKKVFIEDIYKRLLPERYETSATDEREAAEQVLDIARRVWGRLERENQ